MKIKIAIIVVIICIIAFALQAARHLNGKVIRIIDGDTFVMVTDNNDCIHVRMASIDAPELSQAFGMNCKLALAGYINGQEISLTTNGKDQYKRTIATVYFNHENINLKMVANGFAWQYKKYSTGQEFSEAQQNAKQNKLGLWHFQNIMPSIYRHNQNQNGK